MNRFVKLAGLAVAACAGMATFVPAIAQAQVRVYYQPPVFVNPAPTPVVTYSYYPAPVTFAPAPVTTYFAPAPVTTSYYAPAPVTSYYAPGPVTTSYYAPAPVTTSFYAPTTVYSAPVTGAIVTPGVVTTRSYVGLGIFRPRGVYSQSYFTPSLGGTTTYYGPVLFP
ncbi:MAG: hypothetical protein L0215_06385 [Gemmataceae bacterium]|nr:hypothetical protein [Gemmataceae bacterium]